LIRFSDGEHYEEIKEDLDNFIRPGVHIESITTDGHKSILKAIKKSMPTLTVQRCLVHIERMCLLWLDDFQSMLRELNSGNLFCYYFKSKPGMITSFGPRNYKVGMIDTKLICKKKLSINKLAGIGILINYCAAHTSLLKEPYPICFTIYPIRQFRTLPIALKGSSAI
jgi:Transposase, Mutator family